MNCRNIKEQLGAYLDGELAAEERTSIAAHLQECSICAAEFETILGLASRISTGLEESAPSGLWAVIEQRLDNERPIGTSPRPMVRRILAHKRWAFAAVLGLSVGLSLWILARTGERAQAAGINFAVLLDHVPLDARKAFVEFVALHGGRPSSAQDARKLASHLNFELPEELPGGFRRNAVYLLQVGGHCGVAAAYERDGEFLAAIFHPPIRQEDYGTHQDHACVVGKHRGHKVEVGAWSLVHLTDDTTCHCILSRLDEQTELPSVLAALAPDSPGLLPMRSP